MKVNLFKELVAEPGKKHKVNDFSADYTGGVDKKEAKDLLEESIEELVEMQNKLYADNRYAVLVVFQAMDAAGKDGTLKHVMSGLNPQGCQVYSFKQPSSEELDHSYLWRIMKNAPERGRIGIFNRSHYEEVLVTRVHPEIILNQNLPDIGKLSDVGNGFWKKRYRQINDFERYWTENGVIVIKFFLNVSKEEQKERFMERLDDESKNWKFSLSDVKERAYWDKYMDAYSEMLTETSTEHAPWYVIPADKKWFMRYAVGKIIHERMSALNVGYPQLGKDALELLKQAREALENEK